MTIVDTQMVVRLRAAERSGSRTVRGWPDWWPKRGRKRLCMERGLPRGVGGEWRAGWNGGEEGRGGTGALGESWV